MWCNFVWGCSFVYISGGGDIVCVCLMGCSYVCLGCSVVCDLMGCNCVCVCVCVCLEGGLEAELAQVASIINICIGPSLV